MNIKKKMESSRNNYGFILINKEKGPTSHDIIYQLRKITKIKKIGHAGTLDPLASGLLIVAIDREATKKINHFVKLDKKYKAIISLGETTDTYDALGIKTNKYSGEKIKKINLKKTLEKIEKLSEQEPPMYSAKKVNGKKLYELARKNIEIERPKQKIKIFYIKLIKYKWPKVYLEIYCSSGTYIRTIANDIGKSLECGAYLEELQRTMIGEFNVKRAIKTKKINNKNWQKHLFQI